MPIPGLIGMPSVKSFTVSLNKSAANGNDSGFAPSGTVTSENVTATPVDGVPAYTYLWQRTSGDASITPTASTSATTAFSATVSNGSPKTADFKVTVTDSEGTEAQSSAVAVSLTWTDLN